MSDLPAQPGEASVAAEGTDRAYASWISRVGAYLLDLLILIVPIVVLIGILFAADPGDTGAAWSVLLLIYLISLVLPFVYFTVLHGNERGQTYGKRAAGIRVVDERRGDSIGYGRAFGRYAIIAVLGLLVVPVVIDYLWPLWDAKNQALHDKVVGSVVVRV